MLFFWVGTECALGFFWVFLLGFGLAFTIVYIPTLAMIEGIERKFARLCLRIPNAYLRVTCITSLEICKPGHVAGEPFSAVMSVIPRYYPPYKYALMSR